MLRGAVRENAARLFVKIPATAAKAVGTLGRALPSLLAAGRNVDPDGASKLPTVHRTSLNVGRLSDRRVVSYAEFPLADIKALCRRFGCVITSYSIHYTKLYEPELAPTARRNLPPSWYREATRVIPASL